MFDSLTGALSNAYTALAGKKELTEANIDEGIRSVRDAAGMHVEDLITTSQTIIDPLWVTKIT